MFIDLAAGHRRRWAAVLIVLAVVATAMVVVARWRSSDSPTRSYGLVLDGEVCPYVWAMPCERQVAHAQVALGVGGQTLHYSSGRTQGRRARSSWDARGYGLGGWTLGSHHHLDVALGVLDRGDGQRMQVENVQKVGTTKTDLAVASARGREVYVFDPHGRHLRTLDALTGGVRTTFGYTPSGTLRQVRDADGRIVTIASGSDLHRLRLTDGAGRWFELATDRDGYLASVRDERHLLAEFTYESGGLLATMRDARSGTSRYRYDPDGRLIEVISPAGGRTTLRRRAGPTSSHVLVTSPLGRQSSIVTKQLAPHRWRETIIDPRGLESSVEMRTATSGIVRMPDGSAAEVQLGPDPRWGMQVPIVSHLRWRMPSGRTLDVRHAQKAVLGDDADPLSLEQLAETTRIGKVRTTATYAAAHRQIRISTGSTGNGRSIWLDPIGRPVRVETARGTSTRFGYQADRVVAATTRTGAQIRNVRVAYDDVRRTATLVRSGSAPIRLEYDESGRLHERSVGGVEVATYRHDEAGRLVTVLPAEGPAHRLSYDEAGRPVSYQPPSARQVGEGPVSRRLDEEGFVTQLTRPGEEGVEVDYDRAGRVRAMTTPEGAVETTWDPETGGLSSVAAPSGSLVTFAHDGPLPAGQTWSGPVRGSVTAGYDADLRISSLRVDHQEPVLFGYDERGAVVSAGEMSLTRSMDGLVRRTRLGDTETSTDLDGFGQVEAARFSYARRPRMATSFYRDTGDRETMVVETLDGAARTTRYRYDQRGRLLAAMVGDGPAGSAGRQRFGYAYDHNGNLTTVRTPQGITRAVYGAGDQLLRLGRDSFAYSASGDLIRATRSGTTTNYSYDGLGNLVGAESPKGALRIRYLFDGLGRRVATEHDGTLTQGFLYGDRLRPAAELDGAGRVVARFVYATGRNVPDYMLKDGSTYRILTDERGSPRLVVDVDTGVVVQRMEFDPYGQVLRDSNPGFQPFGFTGGLYDRDTGLVHLGHREYDARIGRWMTRDPLGLANGSTNAYAYVGGDPVNRVDPTGLDGEDLIPDAGGFSVSVSTVNPITSGGGGVYGVNLQTFFHDSADPRDWEPEVFVFGTPNKSGSIGFAPGISLTENLAWFSQDADHPDVDAGADTWKGPFTSYGGGVGPISADYFCSGPPSPSSLCAGGPGWSGFEGGAGLGKGLGVFGAETFYQLMFGPRGDQPPVFHPKDCPKPSGTSARTTRGEPEDSNACGESGGDDEAGDGDSAMMYADPHLRTFDGNAYDFNGAGEFVAARTPQRQGLELQVRLEPPKVSTSWSGISAVAARVAGNRVSVYRRDLRSSEGKTLTVWVDGRPTPLGVDPLSLGGGGTVRRLSAPAGRDAALSVEWPTGERLHVEQFDAHLDHFLNLDVVVPPGRRGRDLQGLLGGTVRMRDKDTWRVTAKTSLFDYRAGETPATFVLRDFPPDSVRVGDLSESELAVAKTACGRTGVDEQPFLDACLVDVTLTADPAASAASRAAQVSADPSRFDIGIGASISPGNPGPGAGDIEEAGSVDEYVFSGRKGQRLVIDVAEVENDPECAQDSALAFELLGPRDEDLTPQRKNFLTRTCREAGTVLVLPSDGRYRLTVDADRFTADQGVPSTGTYALRIVDSPEDLFRIEAGTSVGPDEPGIGAGTLEEAGSADVYSLPGRRGDRITVEVTAVDGDHTCSADSALAFDLDDPSGEDLRPSSIDFLTATCRRGGQEFELPEDGTYRLVVSAEGHTASRMRSSIGTYAFRVTRR